MHDDGSLTVRHLDRDAVVELPAAYVADQVQLGYALTVHRAPGLIADPAHVLIDPHRTTRQQLRSALDLLDPGAGWSVRGNLA